MSFDDGLFYVVVNHEEQYSIWPESRPIPAGWNPVGEPRSKDECLAHIDEVWTDIRPKSVRDYLAQMASPDSAE